jgi:hypothetical protein
VLSRIRTYAKLAVGSLIARTVPRGVLLDHANFATFERAGYHVTPVHFYSPIPAVGELDSRARYSTAGVDLDEAGQRMLLPLVSRYFDEYEWEPNTYFGAADSHLLYGVVRHFAPARVVEVGSGFSTRVIRAALKRNGVGELVTIEPYEPGRMPVAPTYPVPIQDVPNDLFVTLGENDILFVDSSHVVKAGSDVTHLVLNVLPALRRGVLVHFHDIFLPDDYPSDWIRERHRFWTEQYILHAFLSFNQAWRVLLSAHQLAISGELTPDGDPASFWIQRTHLTR